MKLYIFVFEKIFKKNPIISVELKNKNLKIDK